MTIHPSKSFTLMLLLLLGASACTPAPALDDEAGVTTVMGDSSDSGSASDVGSEGGSTSESSSTSESASTSESSGNEDESFLPMLEDHIVDPCDILAQDCPRGEKCVPFSSMGWQTYDDHKCVPVLGDQAPGEPCLWGGFSEPFDDCDATSICFFTEEIEGQLIGECVAQCVGSADNPMCTAPGHTCHLDSEPTLALCLPGCDPVIQDCSPGDACYWSGAGLACLPLGQVVPLGEPCDTLDDCDAGQQCIDGEQLPSCAGAACCTGWCDLFDDAACLDQPGTACVPFFEQGTAPAGLENVGLCTLPL